MVGFNQVGEDEFIARRRHLQALTQANAYLVHAKEELKKQVLETAAEYLRLSQQTLNEITGEFTSDDLLGEIFSSFCIGK